MGNHTSQVAMGSGRRLDRNHIVETVPGTLHDTGLGRQCRALLFPRKSAFSHGQKTTRRRAPGLPEDLLDQHWKGSQHLSRKFRDCDDHYTILSAKKKKKKNTVCTITVNIFSRSSSSRRKKPPANCRESPSSKQ